MARSQSRQSPLLHVRSHVTYAQHQMASELPSAERNSHPLFRPGQPPLSEAREAEGIICDTPQNFMPFHMDVYALCLHSKLAGQEPDLVRSHQVVLAQYTVPVSCISVGLISRGSTQRQYGHMAFWCEASSIPASSKRGQKEWGCVCTSPC